MNKHQIEKVAVIGAGLMGHGIALEIAAAGYHVNLYDVTEDILDTARKNIDYGLQKLVDSGKIKVESKDDIRRRLGRNASPDAADALILTFSSYAARKSIPWSKPLIREMPGIV